MAQYNGIVAATVTPTHNDGKINLHVIPHYITFLISSGVQAVYVNGSTGEWCSFSTEERKLLAEAWLHHGRGKLSNIIIHCGALSITDSKDLAKHAEDNGADAIGCISPTFLKPHNEEYLVNYLAEVASAAPTLPFLYYHIPSLTNIHIDMEKFLSLANHNISTFSGLKVSAHDFNDVYSCLEFSKKKLVIYYGFDEQLLAALVMGVKGAIGNFYNFLGNKFNEIIDDFHNGNLKVARDKQVKISMDIVPLYKTYGDGVTKILTSLISGEEMGPSRLPLKTTFTDVEITSIRNHLRNKGYL